MPLIPKGWFIFLFFQGLYQLLEPKVTIRCRQQDVEIVQVGQRWFIFIFFMKAAVGVTLFLWSDPAGVRQEEYPHLPGGCEEQHRSQDWPGSFPSSWHVRWSHWSQVSSVSVPRNTPYVNFKFLFFVLRSCGGIEMCNENGKIKVSNTLESRLELLAEQVGVHLVTWS